jgi:hypothetical protein
VVPERVEDLDMDLEECLAGGPFSAIFEYLNFRNRE